MTTIAATDDEATIRAKVREALAPLTPEQRRAVLRDIDRQFDEAICAKQGHKGIGYPGCPVCAPRTIAALHEMGVDW